MGQINDRADLYAPRGAWASLRVLPGLLLLLCCCAGPSQQESGTASSSPGTSADGPGAHARKQPPKQEPKRRRAPAPPKAEVLTPDMDEQIAPLILLLLEREARIQILEKKLEEAIRETVRSKAKLASQESRAEAASSLAEAEVALKTFRGMFKGLDKRPDYGMAARLTKASAEELKKENYGGSLFLANQVKAQLLDLQDRIDSEQHEKSAASQEGKSAGASVFEAKLARLQALLAEKDARIQKLQRKLDDTIQETVRTKSKLRSQENRAEAASSLAEAETAMKLLAESVPGAERQPEAVQAEALMKIGVDEFKKENYSGSLYATNEVKVLVKDVQEMARSRHTLKPVDGETLFALPLTLKIAVPGKAHEQAAADSAVAWSVERGAAPTAVSYKGPWVRVLDEGGRPGWIYYTLIASP